MTLDQWLSNAPFPQKMQFHEDNVRGTYISIACDFERLMDDLIALKEIDKVGDRKTITVDQIMDYKKDKITHLEMGKKYARSKEALKQYNIDYYNDFIPHFEIIKSLVKYRTILAHGYSEYDEKQIDTTYIDFEFVYKGKRQKERIVIKPFLSDLNKYRHTIMELMGLTLKMRREVFQINI